VAHCVLQTLYDVCLRIGQGCVLDLSAVTLALVGLNATSFSFDAFYTLPTFRKLFVSRFKEVGAWLVNRKQ